jgi:hypothetical protein
MRKLTDTSNILFGSRPDSHTNARLGSDQELGARGAPSAPVEGRLDSTQI